MFYTERLMLRNFDEQADLGTVLQWLNEPGFLHALSADALRPSSRDQAKTSLQSWMKNEGGLPCLVVCERPPEGQDPASLSGTSDLFMAADGKPRYPMIGVVSIRKGRFSFTNRVAELGIAFDKAHQGRGYGTEVLNWTCDYVFKELALHRFELQTKADNARALKCYTKVGFVIEGRQKEAYWDRGVWKDLVSMALLEREWREKHPPPSS